MQNIILLIPHYNNIEGLKNSIKSIDETELEVDLLIIDDGSKEENKPLQEDLEKIYKNGKIFIELLIINGGVEKALNYGLEIIKFKTYQYIGRLDCGDFCKKNKFQKQIQKLEENPEIALLGSWANVVSEDGKLLYVLSHPIDYETIKKKIFINSTFVHPTVVFRKSILDIVGNYPENYKYAEDYAFFFNIIKKCRVENYPEPLLDYVISEGSISSRKRKQQVKSRIKIIKDNFYFGFYPIYGLFRNIVLLFVSRRTTTFLRRFFN